MKSIIILLTAILFQIFASKVQGQWHITGGDNIIASNQYLGTDGSSTSALQFKTIETGGSALPINFFTSNTQRMTIAAGGNVGIGLSSPSNLLHVHDGTFQVSNSTTGSTGSDGFQISNNGNHAELNQKESADMRFFTSNTQYMTLDNVGRLGINQSSPSYRLDVTEGSGSSQLRLAYDGTNQTLLQTTNAGYFKFLPSGNRVGINVSPSATLDVYPNNSGDNPLRLRDLLTSTTLENFLVVDGSGYVKKRNIQNVVSTCATTNQNYVPVFCSPATQIQNSQIYDNGANVGIGTTSFTGTLLEVVDNGSNATPVYASSSGSGSNIITAVGTGAGSKGIAASGKSYGISGLANGAYAYGGSPMPGVTGIADGANNSGTGNSGNVGVYGFISSAQSTSDNYGVYGLSNTTASGGTMNNYGVYGTAANGDHNWAGYFAGDLYASNYLNLPSDAALKTNVQELSDALTKIGQLHPVTYQYLTDQYPQMNLPSGSQIGFIAQDVELVVPEVTSEIVVPAVLNADGNVATPMLTFKGYKPAALVPVAIQGIKELKAIIDQQQQQITDLQSQLDGCCSGLGMRNPGNDQSGILNQQIVELKLLQGNFLGQSIPNPHKDQCTIPYYVELNTGKAEIVFFDNLGREINRIEILGRGSGQVTLFTSQLATGLYSYSLLADGRLIDTKKMAKQD
jgi:hypothetical protein